MSKKIFNVRFFITGVGGAESWSEVVSCNEVAEVEAYAKQKLASRMVGEKGRTDSVITELKSSMVCLFVNRPGVINLEGGI